MVRVIVGICEQILPLLLMGVWSRACCWGGRGTKG